MPPASDGTVPARGRRLRRHRSRAGSVLLALVIITGILGATGLLGYREANRLQADLPSVLKTAADELEAGKTALKDANSKHDPAALAVALTHFAKSKRAFISARDSVDRSPFLVVGDFVPVVGQVYIAPRHHAIDGITTMGLSLVDAGEQAAAIDAGLIGGSGSGATASGPQHILAVLKDANGRLDRITTDLKNARAAERSISRSVVPAGQAAALTKAGDSIAKGLTAISEFRDLVPVLLEILGENGPRTYLIEQADPADLRGGGGFIGTYSVLIADKGSLKIETSADVATIDFPYPTVGMKTYIVPPNPLKQFAQHGWVFGDSNFNPDFPSSAQDAERLFANQTGKKVDGVISLDPWAVALILSATGPLPIPEYATSVDGASFPEVVFQREQAHPNDPEFVKTRKLFLVAVAKNLMIRLTTLPADQWSKVIEAMNTAVSQRHLQAYFNREVAEKGMSKLGWSGALVGTTPERELLAENENNFGATKANHFVERHFDLKLQADGSVLRHTLTVTLRDSTPPGYVNGRYYRFYMRVYMPADASERKYDGSLLPDELPSQEKQPGLVLMDGWNQINVAPRVGYGTGSFTFSWNTPLPSSGQKSIYWQKQPGTLADTVTVTYLSGGHTYTAKTDLGQDRVLVLKPGEIQVQTGTSGAAKLPSLGF